MTATLEPRAEQVERLGRVWEERPGVLGWLTTVDHKRIGILFFFASAAFFLIGGLEALTIRTQLIRPHLGLVGPGAYDQIFTMHGVTMIFFFVIPMGMSAFGNYLVPLMIGARDMAFPRLNAFSVWVFIASGLFLHVSLLLGQAPDAGWFDYVPLALRHFDGDASIDFYSYALLFNGISTTATAVNLVTTIFKLRAPGMSLNRMPLFCYAQLASAGSALILLPPLTLDLVFLELQRNAGFHFFDVAHGGSPLLWQHLFWLFGHPEVYLIVLPAFGIATSIIPTYAKRRMIAAPLVALAEILVAFIGFGVWAHHMFATGMGTTALVFFAAATLMVVIPSTIQIYAWLFTVNMGRPTFDAPLLFIGGFIAFFVMGGLTGIMFAAVPFDQALTDTYFVVAHFHFIIFGAAVFPIFGGLYYWFPKVTGRLYHERAAKLSFWLTFAGTAITFFPMHVVGLLGMPRRVYTYQPGMGWDGYNLVETLGSYVLTAGLLLIAGNLVWSYRNGPRAGRNPFNAPTLEWAATSPPQPYNFAQLPRVTSEYPLWDGCEPSGLVLDEGHEQPLSTAADGRLDAVAEMPQESAVPPVLALVLLALFALLLTQHYHAALGALAVAALLAAVWHWRGPHGPEPARSLPRGVWGVLLLVASEATLLGCVFGSYWYLRFKAHAWPPAGIAEPKVLWPVVLTAILVATSVPMALAARRRSRAWLALALLVQAGWLGGQIHLTLDDLARFAPDQHAYASIYYVLVGAGLFHVGVGIAIGAFLLLRPQPVGLRAAARYWHFVNLVTVLILLHQIAPRL